MKGLITAAGKGTRSGDKMPVLEALKLSYKHFIEDDKIDRK